MSSPMSNARWLRAALVGVSSSSITICSHAAAGGGLPQGSALILVMLACATVGAALGGTRLEGRFIRPLVLVGVLMAAQGLGHLALTLGAGHHDHGGMTAATPAMLAAHVGGAVLLGALIDAVEYLYVVCTSVTWWLRLVVIDVKRPVRHVVLAASDGVAQRVLGRSGLGMRAPPPAPALAA